ncbi:type IV pilin N-terminal domain-containing protein [Methanolobus sp. ZRKC4]
MEKQILIFRWHTEGVSPVIGVILMLFLTILLAGITVSSVYGGDAALSLSKAPMALIEVEYVEGGVRNYPTYVQYKENFLYLEHMVGDPLQIGSTKIIISGEGSSYEGVVPHGTRHYGEVSINYASLLFEGKKSVYASRNPDISDGAWSAGEKLILNGDDAINGSIFSTVSVDINGVPNTANHYGLKEDSMVTIKIFDKESQCIISEFECVVTPVD